MKHFIGFLAVIFAALFFALMLKSQREIANEGKPILRVFAPTSFVSQFGPGPWLRQAFEEKCDCRVEFIDGADPSILFQRLKGETRSGADVVLGFDQYDIESASQLFEWKNQDANRFDFEEAVKPALARPQFLPYDWGVLSFIIRQSQNQQLPQKLDDLLEAHWKEQIAVTDPRTSTPGLQFLMWLIQARGEAGAFDFLAKFNKQVKAYTVSWSMAYGLFRKNQVKTVFSYTTSPVYHHIEEKDMDVVAVEFQEGNPIQFEFVGIPALCRNCDLADKFVQLMLSQGGQKIIMEKNYMFPATKGVKEGTPFGNLPPIRIMAPAASPSVAERERILKKWASLRRTQ